MDEIELKFAVPPASLPALAGALGQGHVSVTRMQAIYFDTADERLGRHGATLRLRKEGRRWIQTAKAATADPLRRLEHNVPASLPRGVRQPVPDLFRHDGEPVGAALRLALGDPADGQAAGALEAHFRTDVSRVARTVCHGGALIELSLDRGTITAGDRWAPVAEFELELKSGDAAAVVGLAAQWADCHGLWLSTVSKADRGARLARGEAEGRPVRSTTPVVAPKARMREFLLASMTSCLVQILDNASEIGAGAADEGFVLQLRVGLRRLRTALRELDAGHQGADPAWEPALRSAFQELGRHRDRTIVLPAVRVELEAAGVQAALECRSTAAVRSPAQLVQDAGFQCTLLDLLAFTHTDERALDSGRIAEKSARAAVGRRLTALHSLLARDAKRFARLDPRRQHRVRKRLKRLRYLSELSSPLFSPAKVAHFLARWRKAQDALGNGNDLRIASDAYRADAEPPARLAVHWLADRRAKVARRCHRALRKASRQAPFWLV